VSSPNHQSPNRRPNRQLPFSKQHRVGRNLTAQIRSLELATSTNYPSLRCRDAHPRARSWPVTHAIRNRKLFPEMANPPDLETRLLGLERYDFDYNARFAPATSLLSPAIQFKSPNPVGLRQSRSSITDGRLLTCNSFAICAAALMGASLI
jgi:hypothetical protein